MRARGDDAVATLVALDPDDTDVPSPVAHTGTPL
jgi:hypothetical protein